MEIFSLFCDACVNVPISSVYICEGRPNCWLSFQPPLLLIGWWDPSQQVWLPVAGKKCPICCSACSALCSMWQTIYFFNSKITTIGKNVGFLSTGNDMLHINCNMGSVISMSVFALVDSTTLEDVVSEAEFLHMLPRPTPYNLSKSIFSGLNADVLQIVSCSLQSGIYRPNSNLPFPDKSLQSTEKLLNTK